SPAPARPGGERSSTIWQGFKHRSRRIQSAAVSLADARLSVSVRRSAPWVRNWRDGKRKSGRYARRADRAGNLSLDYTRPSAADREVVDTLSLDPAVQELAHAPGEHARQVWLGEKTGAWLERDLRWY